MTTEHPITLPSELFEEWLRLPVSTKQLLEIAVQWGADMELEACIKWIQGRDWTWTSAQLRATRRPKPQTLNSIALEMLATIEKMDVVIPEITDTIRRAIEALPND